MGKTLPEVLSTARGRRPRAVLKTKGTVFSHTDRLSPVNNMFIFFLAVNWLYRLQMGLFTQHRITRHYSAKPVSIKYGLRTTDYGLGIKHELRCKTRTKHYGVDIKYGLGYKTRTEHYGLDIKHGLGYEQAHTGCKLHPLSVLLAKATSSTCYVTWPM